MTVVITPVRNSFHFSIHNYLYILYFLPLIINNLLSIIIIVIITKLKSQFPNPQVIVLHREYTQGGSIGVTLAGGADYESKEITVTIIYIL